MVILLCFVLAGLFVGLITLLDKPFWQGYFNTKFLDKLQELEDYLDED